MKSFMYRYANFCPSKKETVVKEHRNRDDPSVRPFKTKTKRETTKKKQTDKQERCLMDIYNQIYLYS